MTGVVVCFLFADARISFGQFYVQWNIIVGSSIAGAAMATVTGLYLYKVITSKPPRTQSLIKFVKSKKTVSNSKAK